MVLNLKEWISNSGILGIRGGYVFGVGFFLILFVLYKGGSYLLFFKRRLFLWGGDGGEGGVWVVRS